MTSNSINILGMKERRLSTSVDAQVLSELTLPGYNILQVAQSNKYCGSMFKEILGMEIIDNN